MRLSLVRLSLAALTLCISIACTQQAQARVDTEDYVDTNLVDLTKFSAHFKSIDLKDPGIFLDYLKITECALYNTVNNSPFKQQEIQQALLKNLEIQQQQDKELYFRIPVTFRISGYNFDTQSFPVLKGNQFIKVNILELTSNQTPVCGTTDSASVTKVPVNYFAKLNSPISVYRIPIQRDIAESVANKLSTNKANASIQTLFGYILLQVEAIQPEVQKVDVFSRTIVRGNVTAIDLYIDQDRKILFKRLDYEENY